MFTTYILLLISIWSIRLVDPVSIRGLINDKPGEPFLTEFNADKKTGVRSEGIFERFVRNYLFLLSTGFVGKDLTKYLRVLQHELSKMEFKYTEKLAKQCNRLVKMEREDLQHEVAEYLQQFETRTPAMQEFLDAMNEVFTMQQNGQFDDYMADLFDFAAGHLYSVQAETKKLLNDVILNNIYKIGIHAQRDLEKKLRHAIKEYIRAH